jgi:hypothetical protein
MPLVAEQLSVAELQARGVSLVADEAIAIVQALLTGGMAGTDPQRPLGPPSPSTILVGADGSVVLRGCGVEPSVAEIGALLHQLLRPGRQRVPGALRYAIARAMREVLAPPFETLEELSRALARFEPGDRRETLRLLFARASAAPGSADSIDAFGAIAFQIGVAILALLGVLAAGGALRP